MKQSEALDMITKIQLAHQAMESVCKRIDELKEENKNLKEALAKQEQGEPVAWRNAAIRVGEDLCSVGPHGYYDMTAEQWLDWALSVVTVHLPPQQRTWVGLTPLNIEDEYVRNYLWERALIAIDDPCCRSHPHENMNEYCQRRTELARHQAKLKEKNTP